MTSINGKVICGTRGGKSFERIDRPDFDSKACPEGTSKCSEITSIENTVCYPDDLHSTHCPITYIEIVDEATGEAAKNDDKY